MNNKRCLYCYQLLDDNKADFHEKCSMEFFGTTTPPILDYGREEMDKLAEQIVLKSVAVTGVQAKLSLTIESVQGDPKQSRFTIVGLWGNFILKPPTKEFPYLPENEDLTMHLSQLFGISTAAHSLIRLTSGELAYITKRFDRTDKGKLAMEDMCQLTETLTADKYHSSMEKVGRHVKKFSSRPGIDAINFFEIVLLCYLTGNADMHLKNFSMLTNTDGETMLSPAYDLVCTKVAMPDDKEEMALTINARKNRLARRDFDSLAANLKIPAKVLANIYEKFAKKIQDSMQWIDISFLPEELKKDYQQILQEHAARINLT